MTFDTKDGFNYRVAGEAAATDVSVTPTYMPDYVACSGHRVEGLMQARVTRYEFRNHDSHRPLQLEVLVTAPGIIADLKGTEMALTVPLPLGEAIWHLAHREDPAGEAYKLRRFQAKQHPVLFEMNWTGKGSEDDAAMSDETRIRLIHIAQ